ncbi:hypothetical protein PV755_34580 [Streptomyces caniscabiei]|uniref:Dynamin family protein n=1 Tax=Streptomyces caniscabiei TaxID=2746961 RepID=A0A927QI54_9ACTN|nr:hypothetical protein [Streptomyces caniscabiei]MBD9728008.1 hypothetical protein [Streptomyces caniscabiei]MDX3513979.1 hypothetical protein [Streptomyces caniscabiei]MDX3722981.1 hypothetical protein [Streptomyces caniscabiei]WEO23495.1 hypothetical protein IHE65_10145 [Streptomyces caniscabiei]
MGDGVDQYVRWAVGMLEALERSESGEGGGGGRRGDVEVPPELLRRRAEFRIAVARLLGEARGPLSIGVVGEFSAGKSLLIETLLGLPGLLSVSDVATTGNVTSVHVTQCVGEERGSVLDGRTVVYCTDAEMSELMVHLHGRLVELARLEGMAEQRLAELRAAAPGVGGAGAEGGPGASGGAGGWEALAGWCRRYGGTVSGSRMRAVAEEVGLVLGAFERGAWLLGRRYELSDAQAKRAMSLPGVRLGDGGEKGEGGDEAGGGYAGGFGSAEEELDGLGLGLGLGQGRERGRGRGQGLGQGPGQGQGQGLGAGSGQGPGSGQQITDDVLADCVPLIRRVELRVRVPRAVWDLRDVGALVLMDFPGLNSPQSGERDRFLSRRELRDIHTVLVLMNAQRGPVAGEQDFFDMLREPTGDGREGRSDETLRESLLVAGGRFDQMPVEPEVLGDLLGGTAERLTERRLRGLPDTAVLDEVVEAAQRLLPPGQRKQLVLVSAMAGLAALRRAGAVDVDASARARLRPGAESERLTRITELWGRIADRLEEDEPGAPLSRVLREFAEDGGLGLLRDQLVRHAARYGGRIRHDAVRRRAGAVDRLRLALVAAEREARPEAEYPPAFREIQQALDDTRRLLTDLRDTLVLGLTPGGVRAEEALRRLVADEAATLVASWPEWKELFAAVDRDKQLVTVGQGWTEEDRAFGDSVWAAAAEMGIDLGGEFGGEVGGGFDGAYEGVYAGSSGGAYEGASGEVGGGVGGRVDGVHAPAPGVSGEPEELLPRFRAGHAALLKLVHDRVRLGYEERLEEHVVTFDELRERWRRLIFAERERGAVTPPRMQRMLEVFATTRVEEWRERLRKADSPETEPGSVDEAFPLRRDRCLPWHEQQPLGRDPLERHVVHAVRLRRELVAALRQLVHEQLAREQLALAATAEAVITARERTVTAHDTLDLLLAAGAARPGEPAAAPLDLAARLEAMPLPAPVRGRPGTGAPPTG